jgi:hypothetical protein
MAKTIVRAFKRFEDAKLAVEQLERTGIKSDQISILVSDIDGRYVDKDRGASGDTGDEAAKGAGAGAGVGGAVGLAAGMGLLVIPGVGQVAAAGWLAATAAGAVAGAALGGAAGGLVGALTHHGLSEHEARAWSGSVRRGDALVSIRAEDADVARIIALLERQGGVDATSKGAVHRPHTEEPLLAAGATRDERVMADTARR